MTSISCFERFPSPAQPRGSLRAALFLALAFWEGTLAHGEEITFQALYKKSKAPITDDLAWRVFSVNDDRSTLVFKSTETTPKTSLSPGRYAVHLSHGLAFGIESFRVSKDAEAKKVTLEISAGGLVVRPLIGVSPVEKDRVEIKLYVLEKDPAREEYLLIPDLEPNALIWLPTGSYHIVSDYKNSNSLIRTDVNVHVGRVTAIALKHEMGEINLSLTRKKGGGAIANPSWIIQNLGGDVVYEAKGTFLRFNLIGGDYDVIARKNDQTYTRKITVTPGKKYDYKLITSETAPRK